MSRGLGDVYKRQVVGLYVPPPGGHGVLDPRQTNRPGKKYREEALWDDGGNTGEKIEVTEVKKTGARIPINPCPCFFPVLI